MHNKPNHQISKQQTNSKNGGTYIANKFQKYDVWKF